MTKFTLDNSKKPKDTFDIWLEKQDPEFQKSWKEFLEEIEEQQLGMAYKTSKSFGGEKNRSKGRYFSTLKGANRNE
jgi:hypothetical protein